MTSIPQRPIRILSFDGGGVRGLSSLIMLRGLMERLSVKTKTPAASIRPSDYFDLIIGTGTGGISAIFVGRMRMTTDEAINAYMRVAKVAFEPTISNPFTLRLWNQDPNLDGLALERTIGDIVQDFLGDRNTKLEDISNDSSNCRTAILAARSDYVDAPVHVFRTYSNRQPASPFSIPEVARATISMFTAFRPTSLGNPPMRFVDAGLSGHNNPVEVALTEAAQLWPKTDIHCVVSLGTGLQQIVAVGQGWSQVAKACRSVIQSCELVHDRVFRTLSDTQYFRFNVDRGLEDTGIMEWKDVAQHGNIISITEGYMSWAQVDQHLDACVSRLTFAQNAIGYVQQQSGRFQPSHHPAPKIFYGREEYVDSAVNMLLHREGVCLVILGTGGIGKTAIACTILHDSKVKSKFGAHRRFISCEGINSISMLVDMFCDAFEFQPHSSDHQGCLIMFLEHAYHATPLLVILDNFETIWEVTASEVEFLLERLANITGISLLLTMRGVERPARVRWTKPWLDIVEPFSALAAYNTFIEICEREDNNLTELLQELDHIPLAVTLMAHLAQIEKPSVLLERWRKEKTKLLSPKQDRSRHNNVDTSISLSLESHRMKHCPEALMLLSILALLPAGAPRVNLTLIIPSLQNHSEAVTALIQTGLAYYVNEHLETLHILSPIRLYILENHPPSNPMLHVLELFYFEVAHNYADKLGKEGDHTPNKSPLLSAANIEAILFRTLLETRCDDDSHFHAKIQAALNWTFFLRWNNPQDTIIQLAIRAIQQHEGYLELHARCLLSLGDIQRMLGNHVQAQEILSTAKAKFEVIGHQRGVAHCLLSLGGIQQMLNYYYPAQKILSIAKAKFEATGDQSGAAQCLHGLGSILNNHHLISRAQAKFEVIGNQYGAAQCLYSLAGIQRMLNNHNQAQEMLSTAKTKFEATGNPHGAAQCLQGLASIQRILDNYDQAQEMLLTAKVKSEASGNQHGAAQCLQGLRDIQRMLDNYDQAQEMLLVAKAKFEDFEDQIGATYCLRSLGDIQRMLNNHDQAQKMLLAAKAKFEAINHQHGVARCLRSLGYIQYSLHNYNQAQEMLSTAKAMFKAIGNQHGVAQCLRSLGDIQQMLNNHEQAQEMLLLAKTMFEAIGNQRGTAQCLQSLGDVQKMLKNHDQAQKLLLTAKAKFEKIGNQRGVVQCLQSLEYIQ